MMLRYQRADRTMVTIPDVTRFAMLGTHQWYEYDANGKDVSEAREAEPDYASYFGDTPLVYHVGGLVGPSVDPILAECDVHCRIERVREGGMHLDSFGDINVIRCHGMWLCNDGLDTIETVLSPGGMLAGRRSVVTPVQGYAVGDGHHGVNSAHLCSTDGACPAG